MNSQVFVSETQFGHVTAITCSTDAGVEVRKNPPCAKLAFCGFQLKSPFSVVTAQCALEGIPAGKHCLTSVWLGWLSTFCWSECCCFGSSMAILPLGNILKSPQRLVLIHDGTD